MQRRLAAILAADVVGYSAQVHDDEAAALARVEALATDVLAPAVTGQSGRIVKSLGDGWLARFDSAVQAITAAIRIQQAQAARPGLSLRIGVHVGDVTESRGDILGEGVNIAARLEGIAPPGGIAISEPVLVSLDRTLSAGFAAAGPTRLKNIDRAVNVWVRVAAPPAAAGSAAPAPETGFPRLAIRPVTCSDPRGEMQDLAAALTSDFGSFFGSVAWLNAAIAPADPADGHVLRGMLRGRGDRIRFEARLHDGAGAEIWADKYDGTLDDGFDWQDRVGEDIAATVGGLLFDAEATRLEQLSVDEMTAEQCLLRGIMIWSSAAIDTYAEAMRFLARAIELKPALTTALAEAIQVMNGSQTYGRLPELAPYFARLPGWIETGRVLSGQDPFLDLALAVADYREDRKAGRLAAALERIERRAPLDARILTFIGWAYNWSGRPDLALDILVTAMRLGRHGPVFVAVTGGAATACVMLGRDREAISHAEAGLRYSEAYPALHSTRAAAHALLGEDDAAAAALARLRRIEPHETISNWRDATDYGGTPGGARYFEGMRLAGMPE